MLVGRRTRRALDVADASMRLGWPNILRVIAHRFAKRSGYYERRSSRRRPVGSPVLGVTLSAQRRHVSPSKRASESSEGRFGVPVMGGDGRPDWFANAITGVRFEANRKHWCHLPDFDPSFGDIKVVWEPSRMQWAVDLARAYRLDSSTAHLEELGGWLEDWTRENPPFLGPNWMCGQETALRLLHLLVALDVVGDAIKPTQATFRWVEMHLERIAQAHHYAVGQSNNHWTSEAAGLFVGAAWLVSHGQASPHVRRWLTRGRRSLEAAVRRLILPDGTFAQYSTNYHRVALDTLSVAELLRRRYGAPPFTSEFVESARRAVDWLREMTSVDTGFAPNFGANDGAYLFRLDDLPFADMRPSVQLGSCVFWGTRAYGEGPWDARAQLLAALPPLPKQGVVPAAGKPVLFDQGGFASLPLAGPGKLKAFVRYPRFRFRPAQSDAMHVDLWSGGRGVFVDAGSFSYAVDADSMAAFSGPEGHNTIQFDAREQMPRLGRFLYARWLNCEGVELDDHEGDGVSWRGQYSDPWGAVHERCVIGAGERFVIEDRFHGHRESAVLRWRSPFDVEPLGGDTFAVGPLRVRVEGANLPPPRVTQGWMSSRYLERQPVNVLEWVFGPGAHEVRTTFEPR